MKAHFHSILACLLAFLLAGMAGGCTKNEFTIEMKFPSDYVGNYIVSYYARDSKGGFWREETAPVQAGRAEVDGITRLPTLVCIYDASNPSRSITFYAERGDKITVDADGSDMSKWKLSGNKLTEQWSAWRAGAPSGEDAAKRNARVAKFVEAHPDSRLSGLLLLMEYDRRENPQGFVKLWNSASKEGRPQELVEMCGAADMLGVVFTADAGGKLRLAGRVSVGSITLRSRGNGIDTLPLSKKPSLLYFHKDNNSLHAEAADSIKAIVKAWPDSTSRIIADISADTDSMTWANAVRYDTLPTCVRAWMPRGLADGDMIRMGAARLPWYRVADGKGRVVYQGQELKEAAKAFRKQHKKK